jgi:hypothetical protein
MKNSNREEGSGLLGFGCGAALGAVFLWSIVGPDSGWWVVPGVLLFGVLGAYFGDRFFGLFSKWWV